MRPKILDMNGLSLRDFSSHDEALAVADELIAASIKEHNHKYAMISYGNKLTDKYFYVQGKGRTRTWYKDEGKTLEKSSSVKNVKMLSNSAVFGELVAGETKPEETEADKKTEVLKGLTDAGRSWP